MNVRRALVAPLLLAAVVVAHPALGAGQPQSPAQPARTPGAQGPRMMQQPATGNVVQAAVPAETAEQTRREFRRVLGQYSPNVGRVLALDPLLLQNPSYLEPYPGLVAFLNQHPEVTRNAGYYLDDFRPGYYTPSTPEAQALNMWGDLLAGVAIFLVFVVVTATVLWIVKTIIDYRRWSRLSKVQTEAHNKLLDRFTANEELLAYISTPSGKRFLESAPIMLDSGASVSSPVKRILWAVEIGLVVVCLGLGFFVAQMNHAPEQLRQMLFTVSVLIVALGLGFILAAVASFVISKRLGVLVPTTSETGRSDVPPAA